MHVTELFSVLTGKKYKTIVVLLLQIKTCGVGLVVECLPSKQETRVRFSYAAQKYKNQNIMFWFLYFCAA